MTLGKHSRFTASLLIDNIHNLVCSWLLDALDTRSVDKITSSTALDLLRALLIFVWVACGNPLRQIPICVGQRLLTSLYLSQSLPDATHALLGIRLRQLLRVPIAQAYNWLVHELLIVRNLTHLGVTLVLDATVILVVLFLLFALQTGNRSSRQGLLLGSFTYSIANMGCSLQNHTSVSLSLV